MTEKPARDSGDVTSGSGELEPLAGDTLLPMWDVDGVYVPEIFSAGGCTQPRHVRELSEKLQLRDTDVLILAYPKSGTHWTWEVVSMLTSGRAEHQTHSKCFTMLEAMPLSQVESQASPRVLNSHLPPRLLPRKQIREKQVKVIQVYRNIRDVFVSALYHFRGIPGGENMTLEDLETHFLSGKVPFGGYVNYMKEMDDYRGSNPDLPFLSLSFEDMKEDPEKSVRTLAQFLCVEASPQMVQEVIQVTSFSSLQQADKSKAQVPLISPPNPFRKGEVGDWKNHMSDELVKRFDHALLPLKSCDYNFRYEL